MALIRPKISVEYTDSATVITFAEQKILEPSDISSLQEAIMSVIDQSQGISLVLDFSNVRFLSSAVLGLLIRLSKKVYEQQGTLKLCCIDEKIYEIFRITRLTKIFDIYPTRDEAADSVCKQ